MLLRRYSQTQDRKPIVACPCTLPHCEKDDMDLWDGNYNGRDPLKMWWDQEICKCNGTGWLCYFCHGAGWVIVNRHAKRCEYCTEERNGQVVRRMMKEGM